MTSHAARQLRDGQLEGFGQCRDHSEAGFSTAIFDPRDVLTGEAAFGCKVSLAPAALFSKFLDALPETDADHSDICGRTSSMKHFRISWVIDRLRDPLVTV